MLLSVMSRRQLEASTFLSGFAVLSMHDPDTPLPVARDAKEHLCLAFHDITEPMPGLVCPTLRHAADILMFLDQQAGDEQAPVVIQCEGGVGRSLAVVAAVQTIAGDDASELLRRGTHNRLLYRLLLEAAGTPVPVEPLVSVVVRAKYPVNRLQAFVLSMQRQRWTNWEIVAVADGAFHEAPEEYYPLAGEPRLHIIETPERKGRWGHPWRQLGIDRVKGEFLAIANDDNYMTAGFCEQMVMALETERADLALCDYVNSYSGWSPYRPSPEVGKCDLCCFMARMSLARQVQWPGAEFTSDGEYIERLAKLAGKVVRVPRCLVTKN